MTALDNYRRFSITISGFKTTHEARVVAGGFDEFRLYADAAVAALEADLKDTVRRRDEAEAERDELAELLELSRNGAESHKGGEG